MERWRHVIRISRVETRDSAFNEYIRNENHPFLPFPVLVLFQAFANGYFNMLHIAYTPTVTWTSPLVFPILPRNVARSRHEHKRSTHSYCGCDMQHIVISVCECLLFSHFIFKSDLASFNSILLSMLNILMGFFLYGFPIWIGIYFQLKVDNMNKIY